MKCPSLLGVKSALPVAFLGQTPLSQLQIGSVCQALAWPGRQAPLALPWEGMPLAGNSGLSFSARSSQRAPFQSVCVPQTPEDTANWLLAFLEAPSFGWLRECPLISLLGVVENVPHTDHCP